MIRNHRLSLLLSCVALTWMAVPSHAVVTFNFDISGSPDPVPTAAQTSAASAAAVVSSALGQVNPAYNAVIDVQFHFATLPALVLGGATPVHVAPGGAGFTYDVVAYNKIRYNNDTNGAAVDIIIEMQSDTNEVDWYYGSDASAIGTGQDDFESTMIHELIHSIGWLESMDDSGVAQDGAGINPNSWGNFDQFLGDGSGTFLNTNTFALDTTAFTASVTEGTGAIPPNSTGLYFHGPNAVLANSGNPVPMYSPSTYLPGSSVSHLDTDFYTADDFVMEHAATTGTTARSLSSVELAILKDIYGIQAIPEPSSIMLIGLASLAIFVRRARVR